jgi:hypothetical protein
MGLVGMSCCSSAYACEHASGAPTLPVRSRPRGSGALPESKPLGSVGMSCCSSAYACEHASGNPTLPARSRPRGSGALPEESVLNQTPYVNFSTAFSASRNYEVLGGCVRVENFWQLCDFDSHLRIWSVGWVPQRERSDRHVHGPQGWAF